MSGTNGSKRRCTGLESNLEHETDNTGTSEISVPGSSTNAREDGARKKKDSQQDPANELDPKGSNTTRLDPKESDANSPSSTAVATTPAASRAPAMTAAQLDAYIREVQRQYCWKWLKVSGVIKRSGQPRFHHLSLPSPLRVEMRSCPAAFHPSVVFYIKHVALPPSQTLQGSPSRMCIKWANMHRSAHAWKLARGLRTAIEFAGFIHEEGVARELRGWARVLGIKIVASMAATPVKKQVARPTVVLQVYRVLMVPGQPEVVFLQERSGSGWVWFVKLFVTGHAKGGKGKETVGKEEHVKPSHGGEMRDRDKGGDGGKRSTGGISLGRF